MPEKIHLVLLSNGENDPDAGVARHLSNLIQFFKSSTGIALTFIRTGDEAAKTVGYQKNKDLATLTIPPPANKLVLSAHHSLEQMIYAGRLADIIATYLHNKKKLIFLANTVDYLRLFEILKERYSNARFIYVHREWSWKRYSNLPDHLFWAYWKKGDVSLSPQAFELTAYEQKIALIAHQTVTLSRQAADYFTGILNIPPDKITTIRNGLAYSGAREYSRADLRNYYGFTKEEKIILCAGKMTGGSGIFYLMDVFKKMAAVNPQIRLLIAGAGDGDQLMALAKPLWSRIHFTGKLSADELDQLIVLSDIGVVPNLYGQCSLAAIYMRYRRLPLIINAIDGLDECFTDGVDALTINISRNEKQEAGIDPVQLEEKITLLLTDTALAERLSDNAYKIAVDNFSVEKMGNGYLDLFYKVMGKSN